jgi:prepilin-type N-terminal cleavage/methylation domain-containing protein
MRRSGFTLVELMVAVTISALLVTSVAGATHSTLRTARSQESAGRAEERFARALEILRDDWRGRMRVVADHEAVKTRAAGSTVLVLVTTADSLEGTRLQQQVIYEASEKGLRRRDRSGGFTLLKGAVSLDFWDGSAWRTDGSGLPRALRIRGATGEESTVLR